MSASVAMSRQASTAHCIPEEPQSFDTSPRSSVPSLTDEDSPDQSDIEPEDIPKPRRRRASTVLIAQNSEDVRRIIGSSAKKLVESCCGGGCCMLLRNEHDSLSVETVPLPNNEAFQSLQLKIGAIPTKLSGIAALPSKTVSLLAPRRTPSPTIPSPSDSAISISSINTDAIDFTPNIIDAKSRQIDTAHHPPSFVQPHPPYDVFSARIFSTRELTKPGASKRTWHFDLEVTDYPVEAGIEFKVGGAIGVVAPNNSSLVDELMDTLAIPRSIRDRPVLVKTESGRWPTVWGDDQAREVISTRRDLLTWCSDIQSYAPTKPLLRLLAEHASDKNEQRILNFLCSSEGQGAFCDFRTDAQITLIQLLKAFPSSKPPLDHLLSVLNQLMPRFYSLSSDPHENCVPVEGCTRLIEVAVTVHETPDWREGMRTGLGSGFFERQALAFLAAQARGEKPDVRIPMFKGLMANPLAKEFVSDGPIILIGAGVGIAPFRGFVQRRLKNANCANKVWVLQGIRDSLVDELYSGEWGIHEDEVKKVVQSRKGEGRYVQEEVVNQKELVWYVINSLNGKIYVCGTRGMGDGITTSLVNVAMKMGNLRRDEAEEFWKLKQEAGQYVSETW